MSYNLTDNQKDVVRWLVQQFREKVLPESFTVIWMQPEFPGPSVELGIVCECSGYPVITPMLLDALVQEKLLLCKPHYESITEQIQQGLPPFEGPRSTHREREINRTCMLTARAFEAVDSNFEPQITQHAAGSTIGAFIHSMSGGTVQAVGAAQNTEISQTINDPDLLRSQIESLIERLVADVGSSLKIDEREEYAKSAHGLKEEILKETPSSSAIRKFLRTTALLGDIEGTISLMIRAWSVLYPLLSMIRIN